MAVSRKRLTEFWHPAEAGGKAGIGQQRRAAAGEPDQENMERNMVYEVGDIVKLKKPHPCGSQEWEILRVGADFRLRCMGCGHQVMMARPLVQKNTRGLKNKDGEKKA